MTARLALVLAISFGVLVSAQQAPPATQETPVRPGPGVQFPTPIRSIQPKYTPEALQARIEGVIELELVILANGTVSDVRVTKSLDTKFGLDQQAIEAAKQWLFRPGSKDGRGIPVIVTIVMEFRLSDRGSPPTPSQTPSAAAARDEFYKDTYPSVYPALVQPVLVRSPQPKYTSDAMRAKIQGRVEVEAVIGLDGTVSRARVTKSLDTQLGLDDSAVEAGKSWSFEPGRLNGAPVPVVVRLMLEFRLR